MTVQPMASQGTTLQGRTLQPTTLHRTACRTLGRVGILFWVLCVGCGKGNLPAPKRWSAADRRPLVEPIVAGHSRPAALPEIVPSPPSSDAQWLPGHWVWQRASWIWRRGGWIENPERLRWVPSETHFTPEGALLFFPEYFVDEQGQKRPTPLIAVPADTPPTPVLAEDATIP